MTVPSTAGEALLKPLRITYIVHHYPPAFRAGAEQYTHRVAKWMQKQGHDVEVITLESIAEGSSTRIDATLDAFEGVPVHRLRFKLVGAPNELTWRYDNPLLERWVADHLAAHQPDFVHLMAGYLIGIGPLRAVRDAGIPMALTLHDYWYVCPRHTLQRGDGSLCTEVPAAPSACARCVAQGQAATARVDKLTAGLYSTVLERFGLAAETEAIAQRRKATAEAITWPNVVIAPTRFLAGKIEANLPMARVRYCPSGYDALAVDVLPVDATQTPLRPREGVQIGYMGQIAQHKGVHVLVEAFRSLDPAIATLHIHGVLESNATYAATLRRLAGDAPNIRFHGGYNQSELPAILASLDAVVAPSIWYENSPLVIMEALGAGVPVITSRLGGMAELVEDGRTGLHFTMGDAAALASTLRTLVGDAVLRDHLRAGARANGRRSMADEMGELQEIYRALVAESTHSGGLSGTLPLLSSSLESSGNGTHHTPEVAHAHRD
jgi:glycosyltransferase involved in cell wall biosynthesis